MKINKSTGYNEEGKPTTTYRIRTSIDELWALFYLLILLAWLAIMVLAH